MRKSLLTYFLLKTIGFIPYRDRVIKKLEHKFATLYGKHIFVEKVRLRGFKSIQIVGLRLEDKKKNHKIYIGSFDISIVLRKLLKKQLQIFRVSISNLHISYLEKELHKTTSGNSSKKPFRNNNPERLEKLCRFFFKKLDQFFESLPSQIYISDAQVELANKFDKLIITDAILKSGAVSVLLNLSRNGVEQNLSIKGTVRRKSPEKYLILNCKLTNFLFNTGSYLSENNITATLQGSLSFEKWGKDTNLFGIKVIVRNFLFLRDSQKADNYKSSFHIDLKGRYNGDGLLIDSTSNASFNDLFFTFSAHHDYAESEYLKASIKLEPISFTEALDSLRLFPAAQLNLKFAGSASFAASIRLLLNNPFQYRYEFDVSSNFKLEPGQKDGLNYLNHPFVHHICNDGRIVKTINLSADDKDFISLSYLPQHLINSVLTVEDPNFYNHNGFDKTALIDAFITNILKRRFTRGGSTISMQLARNLFLHHNKSINRKLEEIYITWLIEDIFKIPKQRCLEIYLNIIEFGPDIYGIQEAATFYFSKPPGKLTLTESLVLTYIIPRPKFFVEALLLKSPKLMKNLKHHLEYFSKLLYDRKLISMEDLSGLSYNIQFTKSLGTLQLETDNEL